MVPAIAVAQAQEPVVQILPSAIKYVQPANRIAVIVENGGKVGEPPAPWLVQFGSALDESGWAASLVGRDELGRLLTKQPGVFAGIVSIAGKAQIDAPCPVIEIISVPKGDEVGSVVQRVLAAVAPPRTLPAISKVLFVVSEDTDVARTLKIQTAWVARYAHLSAEFMDVRDAGRIPDGWLSRYDVVVLATDRFSPDTVGTVVRRLEKFVRDGGGLAAIAGVEDSEFFNLFGIVKVENNPVTVTGYGCTRGFLPGLDQIRSEFDADGIETLPTYTFDESIKPLCTGTVGPDVGVTIAFSRNHGKGRVMGWTWGRLADKSSRGQILSSIMEVSPAPASATLGLLAFFVDDCPLPMTDEKKPPIDKLYDMTDATFYIQKWLPAMQDLFSKFRLHPSFAFVATYDNTVKPPFTDKSYEGEQGAKALEMARKLTDAGYDIGIHGYNHQSLSVVKGDWTVGWPGFNAMIAGFKRLSEVYHLAIGADATPKVYIAPSNFIQKLGKQALLQVFPDIKAIAAQYLDEDSIIGHEFGPDPDLPQVTLTPRMTSEHFLDGANVQEMMDGLVVPGALSHFIHPDDIFDPERNRGSTFEQMVESLAKLLESVDQNHPYLERVDGATFAIGINEFLTAGLKTIRHEDGIELVAENYPSEGLLVFVQPPTPGQVAIEGPCTRVWERPEDRRFYLRVKNQTCRIRWQ